MKPRLLNGCAKSPFIVDAFEARGWDAWTCDILPAEGDQKHIQDDVLNHLDDGWDMAIFHPDCTRLTVTGNKWYKLEYRDRFPNIEQEREDAVLFFMALANADIEKICLENPVGIMSTRWREPDQIIQPFYFGHTEAKLTCLWLKNLPLLRYGQGGQMMFGESKPPTPTDIKKPEYITFKSGKRMAKWYVEAASQPNREEIRSRTFKGIANAMAEQWGI